MKKLNQKGITLIALIITIIVMMILVGVTVAVVQEGGLFTKAELAVTETEKAKEKEMLQAAAIGAYDTTLGKVDVEELRENLPEGWEVEEGENNFICTSPTGNKTVVGTNGTVGTMEENIITATAQQKEANGENYYNIDANETITPESNPTIPAQIKYKDGTVEDVIFYLQYDMDTKGAWRYYLNGSVVENDDGTYSGDYSGGSIVIYSYTHYDGDIEEDTQHSHCIYVYYDGINNPSHKLSTIETLTILDEVINVSPIEYNYEHGFVLDNETDSICQDVNNVTRVILTLPDSTELYSTNMEISEGMLGVEINNSLPVLFIYPEDDVILAYYNIYKDISKITIEENANGNLVRTVINIDMNDELPYS